MTAPRPDPAFHATSAPRGNTRSVRVVALGVTGALHLVAVAVAAVALSWQNAGRQESTVPATLPTFTLRAQDMPHDRLRSGAAERPEKAALLPVKADHPRTAPAAALSQDPGEAAPAGEQGGRDTDLAQVTQAYRRAIMARLEESRRYPDAALRAGWQGDGAVLFRIERSGRLLDATLVSGTGRAELDRAAAEIVRRAAPFPAIPDALPDELAITMPVSFLIENRTPPRTATASAP